MYREEVKLRIFIIEDDPTRVQHFREELYGHDLTIVESCEQVDQFRPPYDVIFFDHDLGGRQLVDHKDNGLNFAFKIHPLITKEMIVVHSYNPQGARAIADALTGIQAPFRGRIFNQIVAVLKERK